MGPGTGKNKTELLGGNIGLIRAKHQKYHQMCQTVIQGISRRELENRP